MKYRTRIYYTEADKALMWERWRQGESLNAIARLSWRQTKNRVRSGSSWPSRQKYSGVSLSKCSFERA